MISRFGPLRQGALLFHAVRKRIFGVPFGRLRDVASEVREVAAAEPGTMAAHVSIPGNEQRATGTPWGTVADSLKWATMTSCVHSPTTLYRIEDVVVDNGVLFKGARAEHVSSLGFPRGVTPSTVVENMVLASTQSGSTFFGDWLVGDSLLELLAESLQIPSLKIQPQVHYPHRQELVALLGLKRGFDDIVGINNLYIVEDSGYNASKRARLSALRSRGRERFPASRDGRLVYLRRGSRKQSSRHLANEEEIEDLLISLGFDIVDPSVGSAEDTMSRIMNSRVVVGVEGSQLAYGFLGLEAGGLMMTLQPPAHFQASWRPRCVFVGISWGFLVGTETDGGFEIAPAELRETLRQFL